MIAAAFALVLFQQPVPTVVWETPTPDPVVETPAPTVQHSVPEWGMADPFGFERARCSPLVRGEKSMETCQTEVREQLALAMGPDLPEALRPGSMAGDCHMTQANADGSAYDVQCAHESRAAEAPSAFQEMDCRPRPIRGGFSSECRPVETSARNLALKLWGDRD